MPCPSISNIRSYATQRSHYRYFVVAEVQSQVDCVYKGRKSFPT